MVIAKYLYCGAVCPKKYLLCLLGSENEKFKQFRENARQYNSAMPFFSFGSQITLPSGYGPYYYKINGDVYHRINSLYPSSVQRPS